MPQTFIKIMNFDGSQKKIVSAESLEDFIKKGVAKLSMSSLNIRLITTDSFDIDDEDSFIYACQNNVSVIFLQDNESVQNKSLCVSDIPIHESTNVINDDTIQLTANTTSSQLLWPLTYKLPSFADLQVLLNKCDNEQEGIRLKCNSNFVNRFIYIIFTDMLKYFSDDNPYPSRNNYCEVCRAIITRFPYLKDTNTLAGFNFWKSKLIRRFKEYRSKIDTQVVQQNRKQFCKKRKATISNTVSIPEDQAVCKSSDFVVDLDNNLSQSSNSSTTDEAAMTTHTHSDICSVLAADVISDDNIQKYVQKMDSSTNPMVIADCMKKLFSYRITTFQLKSVVDEIAAYPHLTSPFILFQEANLVVNEYCKINNSEYQKIPIDDIASIWEDNMAILLTQLYEIKPMVSSYKFVKCKLGINEDEISLEPGTFFY